MHTMKAGKMALIYIEVYVDTGQGLITVHACIASEAARLLVSTKKVRMMALFPLHSSLQKSGESILLSRVQPRTEAGIYDTASMASKNNRASATTILF